MNGIFMSQNEAKGSIAWKLILKDLRKTPVSQFLVRIVIDFEIFHDETKPIFFFKDKVNVYDCRVWITKNTPAIQKQTLNLENVALFPTTFIIELLSFLYYFYFILFIFLRDNGKWSLNLFSHRSKVSEYSQKFFNSTTSTAKMPSGHYVLTG